MGNDTTPFSSQRLRSISERTAAVVPIGMVISVCIGFLYGFIYRPMESRLDKTEGRIEKMEATRAADAERTIRAESDVRHFTESIADLSSSLQRLELKVEAGFDRLDEKITLSRKGIP